MMRDQVTTYFRQLQDNICDGVNSLDPEKFTEDTWQRPGGGGGRSRVLENGRIFEKGGVNFSEVHGMLEPAAAASMAGGTIRLEAPTPFLATGVSLVIHPHNPHAPTVHANFRYFELETRETTWWFGGGADLTPSYLYEEDARHFHQVFKSACDRHDAEFYPRFKKWCDEYFHIRHREEARGIGGIFFDSLNDRPAEDVLAFVQDTADNFTAAYLPIAERRCNMKFSTEERTWQLQRRGRYAEFNLVYDRGTVFGLKTNARIESVLMSLPPLARWDYNIIPPEGSAEARLVEVLRNPVDWALQV